VPDLIGEVATEEATHFSGSRVFAVEKPAGSEIVRLLVELVLLVGGKDLVRVAFQITRRLSKSSAVGSRNSVATVNPFVPPFLQNSFTSRYAIL
jgi:hypothetical protein